MSPSESSSLASSVCIHSVTSSIPSSFEGGGVARSSRRCCFSSKVDVESMDGHWRRKASSRAVSAISMRSSSVVCSPFAMRPE